MDIQITNDIKYIGVDDHDIDLFEGLYDVPNGMAYNSYVILGGKIAVMDTVDARFGKEWLDKLDAALAGRAPDYLVVQHAEPDHSANVTAFMEKYSRRSSLSGTSMARTTLTGASSPPTARHWSWAGIRSTSSPRPWCIGPRSS